MSRLSQFAQNGNALGRMTTDLTGGREFTFGHDLAGRVTRIAWPDDFAVTYALDLAGKPLTIAEEGGPVLATFGYDAPGRRTRLTRGNGVETRLTWDPASRLATLTQDPAGTAQDGATGFAWTAAGQLRSRSQTGAALWDWAGPAGAAGSYAPDKLDRYTTRPGAPPAPTYDLAGNLTSGEGSGQAFAYDVEGKLRIADDLTTFRLIDYDPIGRLRRVGPDGRTMVHAGAQMMAEYDGAALARRHVFAPGLDEPLVTYSGAAKTFHVADERGSVVAATDAAGMVVTSWGYGPHGEPDARGMPPTFGFTGALSLPQLGLTAMRARVYSHRLGRFLQPDPIGQAGGLNLYDYAGGDPVNGWDPWGLEPVSLPEIIITAPQNPIKPGAAGLSLSVLPGATGTSIFDLEGAGPDPYCNIAINDPTCAIVVSKPRVLLPKPVFWTFASVSGAQRERRDHPACALPPIGIGGGIDAYAPVGFSLQGGVSVHFSTGSISGFFSLGVGIGIGGGAYGQAVYNAPSGFSTALTANLGAGLGPGVGYSYTLVGTGATTSSASVGRGGPQATANANIAGGGSVGFSSVFDIGCER